MEPFLKRTLQEPVAYEKVDMELRKQSDWPPASHLTLSEVMEIENVTSAAVRHEGEEVDNPTSVS